MSTTMAFRSLLETYTSIFKLKFEKKESKGDFLKKRIKRVRHLEIKKKRETRKH